MIFGFISLSLCLFGVFLKENTSVRWDSVTEERQLTSGSEAVSKPVEEPGSPVKPGCRKRRHSSDEGKSLVRDSPLFRGGRGSCSETLTEKGDQKSYCLQCKYPGKGLWLKRSTCRSPWCPSQHAALDMLALSALLWKRVKMRWVDKS